MAPPKQPDLFGRLAILDQPRASRNAATRTSGLVVPPSNRLEKLRGDLEGFYSVRINDQWRVVFRWSDGDVAEVQIVDYH